jgi:hypothetical protein
MNPTYPKYFKMLGKNSYYKFSSESEVEELVLIGQQLYRYSVMKIVQLADRLYFQDLMASTELISAEEYVQILNQCQNIRKKI